MFPEVRFDGRVILITGAGRGLGRTYATLLGSRGAKVVVADNGAAMDGAMASTAPAYEAVEAIRAAGGEAVACLEDIASEAGAAAAVECALGQFGRIDGVLHNASTVPDNAPIDRMSSFDMELVMRVNAFAGLWLARAAWPHFQRQSYGRVLFTTSAGVYGSEGNAPYAAAKAALIGATKCLACEGASHGIGVNAIAPAALTRMTERLPESPYATWFSETMRPEKVAPVAAFLMSESCHLNGEMLHAGGGRLARWVLAEGKGVRLAGDAIEDVAAVLPQAITEPDLFIPATLIERAGLVAEQLGFKGGLGQGAFTVTPGATAWTDSDDDEA